MAWIIVFNRIFQELRLSSIGHPEGPPAWHLPLVMGDPLSISVRSFWVCLSQGRPQARIYLQIRFYASTRNYCTTPCSPAKSSRYEHTHVIELDNSSWPMKEARPVCEAVKLPLPRNARLSLLYGSLVSVRQGGMREDLLPSGMSAWDDDIESA
jgi:hypothetical protein